MNALETLKTQSQQARDPARRHLADTHSEKRLQKVLQQSHDQVLSLLKEQQQELNHLRHDLKRHNARGGFPWGLVLLIGAGYALYRTTPVVRDQIDGLLRRVNPGVQGNVTRAGDAARDAVSDLKQGKNPTDAVQRAAGETQRAGEKVGDHAAATWHDVKDGIHRATDDVNASPRKGSA